MFQIVYFTEITRGGSQIFLVCLIGVWQRNFEPAVCVYGTARRTVHTHRRFKITLPNTDQEHEKYL